MKIKRFFAADMRQAIRQVRSEQGPEAVILSSRAVDGGMEIISAVDYDQDLISEMVGSAEHSTETRREKEVQSSDTDSADSSSEDEGKAQQTGGVSPTAKKISSTNTSPTGAANVVWSQDPVLVEMRRELTLMKGLIQDQLSELAWGDYYRNQPLKAQHVKRLEELGFSPRLARQIIDTVREVRDPEKSWREVLYRLAKRIKVCGYDLIDRGGIIAVVGSPGVGKTTTLAKLAARFALQHGRRQVALISTDTYRIGAQKQLQTYGQILGVPVLITRRDRLNHTLEGLIDKKFVLIDTAGLSPRDLSATECFESNSNSSAIKTYVTLAANTQRAALDEEVRAFGVYGLDGCILTKLDEAVRLGDLLSVTIRHRLPLTYLSDGQRIPEDLHRVRVVDLLTRALVLGRRFGKAAAEDIAVTPSQKSKTKEMTTDAHI